MTYAMHQILLDIEQTKAAERAKRMTDGLGLLRGGNAGFIYNGRPAMQCPRKVILRSFFGIEERTDVQKSFIFSHGLSSEWQLVQDLEQWCKTQGLTANVQSAAGITLQTTKGTPIKGSPDFVAYSGSKPIFGVEMKAVNSAYKAASVLSEFAGADAVTQGALYSRGLGNIPWTLIYTSQTQHHQVKTLYGAAKCWEQDRYKHLYDWNDKGEPKSVLGFRIAFNIHWEDDAVFIGFAGLWPDGGHQHNLPRDQRMATVITWKAIRDFYDLCDDSKGATWPGIPINVDLSGKEKYKICAFCEWQKTCAEASRRGINSVAKFADAILADRRKEVSQVRR